VIFLPFIFSYTAESTAGKFGQDHIWARPTVFGAKFAGLCAALFAPPAYTSCCENAIFEEIEFEISASKKKIFKKCVFNVFI
jgi:hypothetical protein